MTDLEIRASTLLGSLPESAVPPLDSRVTDLRLRLASLAAEAGALLARTLDDPTELRLNLDSYQAINRELRVLEQYDAPFVIRWSEADRVLTMLCWRFLAEIGWTYRKPLIGSFSSDYYWVQPRQALIGVPANEEQRLLGLGDLCHELGHIVFSSAEARLRGDILRHARDWFRSHRSGPATVLGGRDAAEFLDDAFLSWRGWLQEFICDGIATYLAGPAYAWQHMRLSCLDDRFPMMHQLLLYEEHPADEARMRLILATLHRLGADSDVADLQDHWDDMAVLASPPDPEYGVVYPDALLTRLAENVVEGCRSIGLRPFLDATDGCDLATLANEAWRQLRGDCEGYAEWERERVIACSPA